MSKPWKPLEKQSLVCPEILTDGYGLLVIEEMLTRLPVSEMTGPLPTTNTLYVGRWERQPMTDRTLDLTKALREAQLQRLEASLLARSATPEIQSKEPIKEKNVTSND